MANKKPTFRNFTFCIYPESMPSNAIDLLINSDMSVIISPLHTPEPNETDEEQKKPHYHVIVSFDGPKDYQVTADRLKVLVNCGPVRIVDNMSQLARYLIHRGWPSKIQYRFEDIKSNYDVRKYYAEDTFVYDIMLFIENTNCKSFKQLIHKLYDMRKFDYIEKVAKMSYYFKTFFD